MGLHRLKSSNNKIGLIDGAKCHRKRSGNGLKLFQFILKRQLRQMEVMSIRRAEVIAKGTLIVYISIDFYIILLPP
jgi:hypothetical protein